MTRPSILALLFTCGVAAAQEAPKTLAVGTEGFWRPSALLQAWYLFDHVDKHNPNTFKIRRLELKLQGEIVPGRFGYVAMIDPARVLDSTPTEKNPTYSVLQDVYITWLNSVLDVSIGQFKNLVSLEGYGPAAKTLLPERATVSKTIGDKRDLGLRADKVFDYFAVHLGFFNGTGLDLKDADAGKDLVVRVEVFPLKGLTLGGLGYMTVTDRKDSVVRDRFEGDLRYENIGFLFQGEYIRGRDTHDKGTEKEKDIDSQGAYAAVAYTFMDMVQPVFRAGFFDPDVKTDDDAQQDYEGGVNIFFQKHEAKFQLAYSFFNFKDNKKDDHRVVAAAQIGF